LFLKLLLAMSFEQRGSRLFDLFLGWRLGAIELDARSTVAIATWPMVQGAGPDLDEELQRLACHLLLGVGVDLELRCGLLK
jgi:hypothetical protein